MYWFLLLIPLIPILIFIYRWVKIDRTDKKIREWQKLSSPDQPSAPEGFAEGDRSKAENLRPVPYLFGFIKIPKRMGPRPASMPVYDELTKQATLMSFRPWVRALHGFEWIRDEEDDPNPTLNIILISFLVALISCLSLFPALIGVMYLLNLMWAYKVVSTLTIYVIMVILILWSTHRDR